MLIDYYNKYSTEYNVLRQPPSPSIGLGWKHSEANLYNMSIAALNRKKIFTVDW